MGVKFNTKRNFGLLSKNDPWTPKSRSANFQYTRLNNYGLISRHTSSINCVNNCTCIFTRHQPRLFLKALLGLNVFQVVGDLDLISFLVILFCELGQIMTRYGFVWAKGDFEQCSNWLLTLPNLILFPWIGANNDQTWEYKHYLMEYNFY